MLKFLDDLKHEKRYTAADLTDEAAALIVQGAYRSKKAREKMRALIAANYENEKSCGLIGKHMRKSQGEEIKEKDILQAVIKYNESQKRRSPDTVTAVKTSATFNGGRKKTRRRRKKKSKRKKTRRRRKKKKTKKKRKVSRKHKRKSK